MTIRAFNGAAGTGKTYSLMAELSSRLAASPLGKQQRVLALTFMHGARHRLDGQLATVPELHGRYDATTVDSFAWRLCRRWCELLAARGLNRPTDGDFDACCVAAGSLLKESDVRAWIANTYPYLIIDEAQDLTEARLAIVSELSQTCHVILAFDEFQCLARDNKPTAILNWQPANFDVQTLAGCRRTNVRELIGAANQVRGAQQVTAAGVSFSLRAAPHRKMLKPVLAATFAALELVKGGSFALLTPSRKAPYAGGVVDVLQTQSVGKGKLGPFSIRWEEGDEGTAGVVALINGKETFSCGDLCTALDGLGGTPVARSMKQWVDRWRSVTGEAEILSSKLRSVLDKCAASTRHFRRTAYGGPLAMTIHQAKNREFDHVVVVWPYQVGGDADDKRRLLYNAITRAKASCLVLVQDPKILTAPPFA